MQLTCHK